MPWETLSQLLLNLQRENRERPGHYIIPSAGHRKSLELYFWANHIEGLQQGIYHYDVNKRAVTLVALGIDAERMKKVFPSGAEDLKNCSAVFIVTSIFDKVVIKYRNRALRFIFIEAGIYLDRLWMLANTLGLEGSILGGGYDEQICEILKINSLDEGPLACFILGYRSPEEISIQE